MTDLLQLKDGTLVDDPLSGIAPVYGPRQDEPPHGFRRVDAVVSEALWNSMQHRWAGRPGLNIRVVTR